MQDRFGRNIEYLRISITDRCNLRCLYCMPEEGIKKLDREKILSFEEIIKIVKACASLGIKKIRYTGGEPLIIKGIENLIHETAIIPGIEDIAITTNGILLYDMAEDLKRAGLKRVNISLDTLNEDKYRKITRGGDLKKVLMAIEKCIEIGMTPVKLNVVLIRGLNDNEVMDLMNLTMNMPVEVRFIELMPIGEGVKYYDEGRMSTEEIINSYPSLIPVESDLHSTATLYKLKNAKGNIGFITPLSCKFCDNCNRIRLTSTGTIKPCLHSREEVDIRKYVENEAMLIEVLKSAISSKPEEHHLNSENISRSEKDMYQIGS
jgi:cyclic pyranopterin phosphate synthase